MPARDLAQINVAHGMLRGDKNEAFRKASPGKLLGQIGAGGAYERVSEPLVPADKAGIALRPPKRRQRGERRPVATR